MGRLIGTLVLGALFAIGYVVFTDGLSGQYVIGGDAGFVMSGGRLIISALALLTGIGAIAGQRRGQFLRLGVGLALLGFVGWTVIDAFGAPARTADQLREEASRGSAEAQICLAANDLISMARTGGEPSSQRIASDIDSIRAVVGTPQFPVGDQQTVRGLAENMLYHWDRNFTSWFADTLADLGNECRS